MTKYLKDEPFSVGYPDGDWHDRIFRCKFCGELKSKHTQFKGHCPDCGKLWEEHLRSINHDQPVCPDLVEKEREKP